MSPVKNKRINNQLSKMSKPSPAHHNEDIQDIMIISNDGGEQTDNVDEQKGLIDPKI